MNTYTIAQAKGMVGQVIPRMEAKLVKIYDRKTGEGEYGPYSFQNGEIQDSTGSMKIVFGNHPDQSHRLNDSLVFKSMTTKRGMKGVEVKPNEYNGKVTMELKLSATAMILGSGQEGQEQPQNAPQSQPAPNNNPSKPAVNVSHIAGARNRLSQFATLYGMAYKQAVGIEELPDTMSLGDIKDIASCLFIQAVREGLAEAMPIRSEKPENEGKENDDANDRASQDQEF